MRNIYYVYNFANVSSNNYERYISIIRETDEMAGLLKTAVKSYRPKYNNY